MVAVSPGFHAQWGITTAEKLPKPHHRQSIKFAVFDELALNLLFRSGVVVGAIAS